MTDNEKRNLWAKGAGKAAGKSLNKAFEEMGRKIFKDIGVDDPSHEDVTKLLVLMGPIKLPFAR